MKVLLFTNTPFLFNKTNQAYNGGGWIESLEQILSKRENIELAVAFFYLDKWFKVKHDKTTYYPISIYKR